MNRNQVLILAILITTLGCSQKEQQQATNQASVTIDTEAKAKLYDPMIFGGFIEHFGRQIYGGFFEPGSPLADELGFRLDVIEAPFELLIETPIQFDLTDAIVLGDSAEIGDETAVKFIDTPAEALVLGDFPDTAFNQGPVTTGKTLMIAEFKLTGGTLFRAAKGIRHPERFLRGTFISFWSIIKSIPFPAGLP